MRRRFGRQAARQLRISKNRTVERHGYWHESDGTAVTPTEAYRAWAEEAYGILAGVARAYHAGITYGELAEEVQKASGVQTSVPMRRWIGKVLFLVVHRAYERGNPPLTSLVVHSTDGKVGDGYKAVLETAGHPSVEDDLEREHHAAAARLDCYRYFGATLPRAGGVPALAPRLQDAIARRHPPASEPPPSCPTCHVQLPATGTCDSCGYQLANNKT
jgi:hypothetical protein